MRRVRSRKLRDPLARGVLTLVFALLAAAAGVILLRGGAVLPALGAFGLASAGLVAYGVLVAIAWARNRARQYHHENRQLRRAAGRQRAKIELQAGVLDFVAAVESEPGQHSRHLHAVLALLVSKALAALEVDRVDGVAALLILEANRRRRLVQAATNRWTRWRGLEAGEELAAEVPLGDLLATLASQNFCVVAEIGGGRLYLAILCEAPLEERDQELLRGLSTYVTLIARRWRAPAAVPPGSAPSLLEAEQSH
jgi:hypothetical protein